MRVGPVNLDDELHIVLKDKSPWLKVKLPLAETKIKVRDIIKRTHLQHLLLEPLSTNIFDMQHQLGKVMHGTGEAVRNFFTFSGLDERERASQLAPILLTIVVDRMDSSGRPRPWPALWAVPTQSPHVNTDGTEKIWQQTYPKHVMMMTRGTRGDVQPFIALARGLAQLHGWLVTIVTEMNMKEVQTHQKRLS
jgi:hypothetical protein